MKYIVNPFQKHQLEMCCGTDELRPFTNYIYFIDGIAYTTNAYVLVALSLKDIDADKELIECLEGYKIHHTDMRILNLYERIFPSVKGKIYLNGIGTLHLQLNTLAHNDKEKEYQKILDKFELAKADLKTKSITVETIKINLHLIESVSKAFGFLSMARFHFLKELDRVYMEFDNYENSMAVVMPMADDKKK